MNKAVLSTTSAAALLLFACAAAGQSPLVKPVAHDAAVSSAFRSDISTLVKGPHRLAGFADGSIAASKYVQKRLAEIGVREIYVQDFPLVQPITTECKLLVDGKEVGGGKTVFYAMRPNILQASVTPAEGISGQTLYVGAGQTIDYKDASAKDRIVVLDFDCDKMWLNAFAFGARAVIFIAQDTPAAHTYHHLNVPANLPRFYITAEQAEALELKKRPRKVKILAACEWKQMRGRNVVGVIRGTSAKFDPKRPPQAMVLAAPLDSLSEVPMLSPGARDGANCASLLLVAKQLVETPPARDIIICFFDGQSLNHLGARAFYGALFRVDGKAETTIEDRLTMLGKERGFFRAVHELVSRDKSQLYTEPDTSEDKKQLDEAAKQFTTDRSERLKEAEKALTALSALRKELTKLSLPTDRLDESIAALRARVADDAQLRDRIAYLSNKIENLEAYFTASVRVLRNEARSKASEIAEELRPLRRERSIFDSRVLKQLRRLETQHAKGTGGEGIDAEIAQEKAKPEVQSALAKVAVLTERISTLVVEERGWNSIRRILNDRDADPDYDKLALEMRDPEQGQRLKQRVPQLLDLLIEHGKRLCLRRVAELDVDIAEMHQAKIIRDAVGAKHNTIVLHVSVNLGDARNAWSFIHGDNTLPLGEDRQYTTVFKTALKVHKELGSQARAFDAETVSERYPNRCFAPGLFAESGSVARLFAISNIAAMTVMDPMARQGQPCDTLAMLNTDAMFAQAGELAVFIKLLADHADLNISKANRTSSQYAEASWSGTKAMGATVRQSAGGSSLRAMPVRGATVAVVRTGRGAWGGGAIELVPPGFSHPMVVKTNTNGHLNIPVRLRDRPLLLAVRFDTPKDDADATPGQIRRSRGIITHVTSESTLVAQTQTTKSGAALVRVRSKTIVGYGYSRRSLRTTAMRDISTASFAANRHLVCESGNVLTIYAPFEAKGFKLFNRFGMVVLNNTEMDHLGKGISLDDEFSHPLVLDLSSEGVLNLNGARLSLLRRNRINQGSLELLHGQAKQLRKRSAATLDERLGDAGASKAISGCVYIPLVGVMNDLVTAVVLLLLLAIPFAFAVERLVVGSPHIYRQIGWFAVFFLITFGILFLVNPAFRLAATPIIIFLAFTIILLSSLVIFIMVRKLQNEIKKMQGLASTVHSADVSRLSTTMAAVSMGISTMRRRPLRTALTAVTVILLTFTILTFASFGSSWGTRKTYEGPLNDAPPRILLRHQLWGVIEEGVFDTLRGRFSRDGAVVPRYWVAPTAQEVIDAARAHVDLSKLITNMDVSEVTKVSAAIGLDTRDLQRQPKLRTLFTGSTDLLETDGIFLTAVIRDSLGLTQADVGKTKVCFDDQTLTFAGTISGELALHTMVEGSDIRPVDYQSSAGGSTDNIETPTAAETLTETPGMESAQFLRYGLHEVVVVSPATAQRMRGRIRSVCIYPNDVEDIQQLAEQVATVSVLPTYVGDRGGVYRLIFTSLTEASGARDLLVPVLLGGMIIFATMLGSVSDREREIYTFSSLGLAPAHVASLFFAEASMYAVVGGMGGYLLGQSVAWLMNRLSDAFGFSVPVMNYSSTNAIVTILIVMGTVLISTIYPAVKASRSANPGIQRSWQIPKPVGNLYDILFPFTVSGYDIIGMVSFLKEHFDTYSDASLGVFATAQCRVFRQKGSDMLGFRATVALAPFDLGVNQEFALLSKPSEIEGIDEINILLYRLSGANGDWRRGNRVFINDLRKQLLIWRSLGDDVMDKYRQRTLEMWDSLPIETVDAQNIGGQA